MFALRFRAVETNFRCEAMRHYIRTRSKGLKLKRFRGEEPVTMWRPSFLGSTAIYVYNEVRGTRDIVCSANARGEMIKKDKQEKRRNENVV